MIAADYTSAIRQILRRLKRDKLESVLREWDAFEKESVTTVLQNKTLKTKKAVVEGLVDLCQDKKLTKKDVAKLDLIYSYHNSESKKWCVYHLVSKSDQHAIPPVPPKEFGANLRKQLSFFFKHDLSMKKVGDAVWIRIGIHEGVSSSSQHLWLPSNVIYMIHHPCSQYIIISKVKVSHRDYLMQALLCTLQCSEIKELQLSGKSVDSLADMVLHKQSQGGFAQYRLNKVHTNPLTNKKSRKRKASSEIDVYDIAVQYENSKDKAQQEKHTQEVFGAHRQPKLQKLEYRLETRFRGVHFAPAMALRKDEPFRCNVKFEGPSVLEGIKGLGSKGLAIYPLPYHISNVHSLAKNHFVLADKKKTLPVVGDGGDEDTPRTSRRGKGPANS